VNGSNGLWIQPVDAAAELTLRSPHRDEPSNAFSHPRGILSPKGKSIRTQLSIVFPGRNHAFLAAIQANVSAYLLEIADRKNYPFHRQSMFSLQSHLHRRYADHAYHSVSLCGPLALSHSFIITGCYADISTEESRCQTLTYSLPCSSKSTKTSSPWKPPSWSLPCGSSSAGLGMSPITFVVPWLQSTETKSSSNDSRSANDTRVTVIGCRLLPVTA